MGLTYSELKNASDRARDALAPGAEAPDQSAPILVETHWLRITSTTTTDGRYPGERYDRDSSADTFTAGEECWIDAVNDEALAEDTFYLGKLGGVNEDDDLTIYDVVTFRQPNYRTMCIAGSLHEVVQMPDGSQIDLEDLCVDCGCPPADPPDCLMCGVDLPSTFCWVATADIVLGVYPNQLTIPEGTEIELPQTSTTANSATYLGNDTISGETVTVSVFIVCGVSLSATISRSGGGFVIANGCSLGGGFLNKPLGGGDLDCGPPTRAFLSTGAPGNCDNVIVEGSCVGSGSGSGSSGGISRSSLGTASSEGAAVASLTKTNVTVSANSLLVVVAATIGNLSCTVQFAGHSMTATLSQSLPAGAGTLEIFYYYSATEQTGNIVATPAGSDAPIMFEAVEATGFTSAGLSPFDIAKAGNDTATTPDAGTSSTTSYADEYVQGAFLLSAPVAGELWIGSFINGGQDLSMTVSATEYKLTEAYRILTATGTFNPKMSGSAPGAWAGIGASFR